MKISDAIKDFLAEQVFRGNTQKTIRYYTLSLGRFTTYLAAAHADAPDPELDALTIPMLRGFHSWLVSQELSTTSIQSYVRALRSFLTFCHNQDFMTVNLSEKFKLPKAKRHELDILSDNEVKQLFSVFNVKYLGHLRDYCICALMLDSGLRMNEVTTLRLDKLKLTEGFAIVCGKGNKERVVPLGLTSRRMLARYVARRPAIARTERVFLMANLSPITDNTIQQIFKRLKTRAGIPRIRAHLLRHTFATRYLENGGEMYSLQQILGHTSLEMVKRYVHTTHKKFVPTFGTFSPMDNILRA